MPSIFALNVFFFIRPVPICLFPSPYASQVRTCLLTLFNSKYATHNLGLLSFLFHFIIKFHCSCHSFSFTIASNTGSRKVWISVMMNENSSVLSFMVFKKNFQRFCISSSSPSATTRLKLSLS